MKISLDPLSHKLRLHFPYNQHLVEAVKALPDSQYSPGTKEWLIGFDKNSLGAIFAFLAGNSWPKAVLDQAETEARAYLALIPEDLDNREFLDKIKPRLMRLGELVLSAYEHGEITQEEQVIMVSLLNHLSLKDFIR